MLETGAHRFLERLHAIDPVGRTGRVRRILPTYIEADGPAVPLGTLCSVEGRTGVIGPTRTFLAEVASIGHESIILVPFDDEAKTFPGARVQARADQGVPVGSVLLARAVDALGHPLDGQPLRVMETQPLQNAAIRALDRHSPATILDTGIRAIDGLLTLGVGQRVGVFAASGVGKTSLMSQLAHQIRADRCVVCLVGERGREVEDFWHSLPKDAKSRTTLVAATSDESAAMRVRSGYYALAVADYWRQRGEHVLLLLDSVTRLAMAMREVGLAAGEPPTVRAYTPSVFANIPKMVEQCGALKAGGAVTAIMTVLSETDDIDDPIAEMMKSLLDGHIILSRSLAEQGHFPAIDMLRSISRQATRLMAPSHRDNAARIQQSLGLYEGSRTLIEAGIYAGGSNVALDRAIAHRPAIHAFLRQKQQERSDLSRSLEAMAVLGREKT